MRRCASSSEPHRKPHAQQGAPLLAATTALCLAWPAHAGRPLSVDDAGVDEVGQGHVEVWWEGQRGQPGTVYMAPRLHPHDRTGAGRRAGA